MAFPATSLGFRINKNVIIITLNCLYVCTYLFLFILLTVLHCIVLFSYCCKYANKSSSSIFPPAALETYCPHFFFQLFFGHTVLLWPCSVQCCACLLMLPSLVLSMRPSQFPILLLSWSNHGFSQFVDVTNV